MKARYGQEELSPFNSINNLYNTNEDALQGNSLSYIPIRKRRTCAEIPPSIFSIPDRQNLAPSGFVQCIIHRGNGIRKTFENDTSRTNSDTTPAIKPIPLKSSTRPRYTFSFQTGSDQIAIIAEKQLLTTNPTYFFYDATRVAGQFSGNLRKKSGHFIGTLQKTRMKPIKLSTAPKYTKGHGGATYSLFNASERKD